MSTIIIDDSKLTLKKIIQIMFVNNPWSWVDVLFAQLVALSMLKIRVIWAFIDQSNTSIWSSTIGLVIFLVILIKLLIVMIVQKRRKAGKKADEFMLVKHLLGLDWVLSLFGDIMISVFAAVIVLAVGVLL